VLQARWSTERARDSLSLPADDPVLDALDPRRATSVQVLGGNERKALGMVFVSGSRLFKGQYDYLTRNTIIVDDRVDVWLEAGRGEEELVLAVAPQRVVRDREFAHDETLLSSLAKKLKLCHDRAFSAARGVRRDAVHLRTRYLKSMLFF
jgi:hypothetical protein